MMGVMGTVEENNRRLEAQVTELVARLEHIENHTQAKIRQLEADKEEIQNTSAWQLHEIDRLQQLVDLGRIQRRRPFSFLGFSWGTK